MAGVDSDGGRYVVIAVLAVAKGIQTDAIRYIHVPEIPLAAATLATVGFVVGITGEHGERSACSSAQLSCSRSWRVPSSAPRWRDGSPGSCGR